jgi:OmpA-OmpF porin, OOP family
MKKYLGLLAISIILQGCGALGKYPQGSGGYDERNKDGGTQNPNGGRQQTPTDDQYPTDRGGSTNQRNPQTGRSADNHIRVGDIRLTDQYTILYLSYVNNDRPRNYTDNQGRQQYDDGSHQIAWSNISELIAANGARTFRFVKAEGIPTIRPGDDLNRKGYRLVSGKSINFVVYFDRLDRGLENFDLFECQSDGYTCWNVYDLYVRNPADNIPPPVQNPQPTQIPPPVDNTPTKTRTKTGKVGEVDNTPPPAPVVTSINVGGVVRDVKTNRPVSATIDYQLSSSKQIVDSVQSFASTGLYRMTLPKGQVYTYVASAKGYLSANGVLDLSKTAGGQKITKDIYLTPIAVGDKIVLKNIYFEVSKSDLLPASFAELNKLVSMMQDNPLMIIRLEGHTDVVGDPEANLELSQDRVDACEVYLVKQGIPSARIEAKGYGDTQPIVKKGTDEERKVNRRVEFVVLKL